MAAKLDGDAAARLQTATTQIYEACSFQDITGQRITKVVKTLKHIESKVEAILAVFGSELESLPAAEAEPAKDEQQSLLNGPALPNSGGNTQADIDALLASFD